MSEKIPCCKCGLPVEFVYVPEGNYTILCNKCYEEEEEEQMATEGYTNNTGTIEWADLTGTSPYIVSKKKKTKKTRVKIKGKKVKVFAPDSSRCMVITMDESIMRNDTDNPLPVSEQMFDDLMAETDGNPKKLVRIKAEQLWAR